MEGEKERSEEKVEEEELPHHTTAASFVDHQDLPVMHWEDLSQWIIELEKQEQERRERSKSGREIKLEESQGDEWRALREDSFWNCRVAVITSRLTNHRNLQLCYINDSDSEDEEQVTKKKVSVGKSPKACHTSGLKQEVTIALRSLRDELLAQQKEKEQHLANSSSAKRKHLERWELLERTVKQLTCLKASLQQEIHALSSDLVALLLVRDQLRTKQDAMLLDVQDLT